MIAKAAQLAGQEITEAELRAINKYAPTPLKAEDVFTFKAVLCDNEVDRDFERFNLKALQDLKKLFLGKTVIKDHRWAADSQVARIYATELVQSEKATKSGELYTQLIARCYMVKTASNADLIAEIKGGIKKEGSIGCSVTSSICSICGTDNAKTYCPHYAGRSYEKAGGAEVCTFTLAGARDAYEFSLVAVPAQKAAGVSKSYTGKTVYEDQNGQEQAQPGEKPNDTTDREKAAELALQAELAAIRAKNTYYN
jgi:hypothetical protein